MKLYVFTFEERDPHRVFTPLSGGFYSLFFDSADPGHALSRYSFIAFHPVETVESKNGKVTVTNRDQQLSFYGQPFEILKDRLDLYGMDKTARDDLPPFQCGAAGFFGYDLAHGLEALPDTADDAPDRPDMAVGIYDQVAAFDRQTGKGWYMVYAGSERDAETRYAHFLRLTGQDRDSAPNAPFAPDWRPSCGPNAYRESVRAVRDYIYAGDIFQANLSQRFTAALPPGFDPYAHYLVLRDVNPAPFAAYMNFGSLKLASASPERFLSARNRQAETRPIKGTCRRESDEAIDQLCRNRLENSDKDRAENTMIVDLMRNDLSRVCEDHSIAVPHLCRLESFANVHHLVSVVQGTLRADQGPVDLLRACFPGGSITGAPKIRAMEIIAELEKTRRGPYCGAMGYIGFGGTMDTNIAIRTLVYEGDTVHFNVGGGIVADSSPEDEYDETLVKAEGIFKSFDSPYLAERQRPGVKAA